MEVVPWEWGSIGGGRLIPAMGGGTNKILLPLEGMPILAYSLSTFAQCPFVAQIVIVARREDMAAVEGLAQEWGKKVSVVEGGRERQESVYLGLQALGPDIEWVLVHDAARPFVTQEMIENVLAACKEHSAATVAVPVTDTIKVVEGDLVQKTLPRDKLWAVQTPQAFLRELLVSAHQSAAAEGVIVTDDCALVERFGGRVVVVSGDYSNIKITTAADLGRGGGKVAAPLIGYGFDVHRMVTGRRLVLAGVEIPYELGFGPFRCRCRGPWVSDALLAQPVWVISATCSRYRSEVRWCGQHGALGEVVQLLNEHGLRP